MEQQHESLVYELNKRVIHIETQLQSCSDLLHAHVETVIVSRILEFIKVQKLLSQMEDMSLGNTAEGNSLVTVYCLKTRNNHAIYSLTLEKIRKTISFIEVIDTDIHAIKQRPSIVIVPLICFSSLDHYLTALDLDPSTLSHLLSECDHVIGVSYS
jgi:hypothetical protein